MLRLRANCSWVSSSISSVAGAGGAGCEGVSQEENLNQYLVIRGVNNAWTNSQYITCTSTGVPGRVKGSNPLPFPDKKSV